MERQLFLPQAVGSKQAGANEVHCAQNLQWRRKRQNFILLQRAESDTSVYRVMTAIGITHRPNRKPNGITKAEREARKSDDLLKRNFKADKPFSKCVTDITKVKAKNGKLYVSAIFDCYDLTAVGLSMDDNMRAELCAATVANTAAAYPEFHGAVLHSDRRSRYTSASYRAALSEYGVKQSMNSVGGRCHENARCESMWARMKNELFYSRGIN